MEVLLRAGVFYLHHDHFGGSLMKKTGFDNEAYIREQSLHIRERIKKWGGKLYLEFGGKLFDDYHAARVLPGFDLNGKIKLLSTMKDECEIIFTISADSIEKTKIRADLGISYAMDLLRQIDAVTSMGIMVSHVIITQYSGQKAADIFKKKLTNMGINATMHYVIESYPTDLELILSQDGYGKNPYVPTTKPLVVVTAPGPGCGKLATCLNQIYHEHNMNVPAGYAKFETFPIWNLPLNHPVNLAYEAATADLNDVNMVDPFHLEAYGISTVNYNRDVDAFPIVKRILSKISLPGAPDYQSPTDMGVNMAGYAIVDDEVVQEASKAEILRRYFKTLVDAKQGLASSRHVDKIRLIMEKAGVDESERVVRRAAIEKHELTGAASCAIELDDGIIITGKESSLMSATAATVINALKYLAGIDDALLLLAPTVIEPIIELKRGVLHSKSAILKLDDVLMALAVCAPMAPVTKQALDQIGALRDCDFHSSQMLHYGDESTLRKLGVRYTSEAVFPEKYFFL